MRGAGNHLGSQGPITRPSLGGGAALNGIQTQDPDGNLGLLSGKSSFIGYFLPGLVAS